MKNKKYKKSPSAAFRTVENEAVIITPSEGIIRVLNGVGTLIWQHLDGTRSLSEICDIICGEFDIGPEDAANDLSEFIEDLEKKKLIEPVNE